MRRAGDRPTGTGRDSASGGLLAGGRGWVLATVAIGWFLVFGTRFAVPALLPGITSEFEISNTTAGTAVSLIWVMFAVMQFPSGLLTDRWGERGVLLASGLVAILGVVTFAAAPVFGLFLAGCVVFGLGTGLFGIPRVTILSDLYGDRDGTALGLTFAAGNLGAAVLPFAAGLIGVTYGWRAGFAAVVPLFVLLPVAIWRVVPSRSTSLTSAVRDTPRTALRRIGTGVATRPIALVGTATTLFVFTYQGYTAFLPTYLVDIKGLSPGTAGALFGAVFATGAAVQPLAGIAADRYGDRPVLLGIAVFHALTLAALPFVGNLAGLAIIVVALGVRAGSGPINNAYLVGALADDVQGAGYGLIRTAYITIGATGSIVVGAFADADLFDEAFFLFAGLIAVAAVLYFRLPARSAAVGASHE